MKQFPSYFGTERFFGASVHLVSGLATVETESLLDTADFLVLTRGLAQAAWVQVFPFQGSSSPPGMED